MNKELNSFKTNIKQEITTKILFFMGYFSYQWDFIAR